MGHRPPDRIRNVALIGHRGSGKTSLAEAILFEAGKINRLGSVVDGTTVCDYEDDEHERQMSIDAAVASIDFHDRKINLIDTPGEPSFVADALAALRVVDSAVVVVNAVTGVEVHTERLWKRAADEGLSRLLFVNMLDRERADFFRTLDSLKAAFGPHVVATEIPIGSEHEVRGVVDLIDMKAFVYEGEGRGNSREAEIPEELAERGRGVPREADGRGRRELGRADGALPGGRGDLARGDRHRAEEGRHRGPPLPGHLRDRDQEPGLRPAARGAARGPALAGDARARSTPSAPRTPTQDIAPDESGQMLAYVFKTTADPYTGRINLLRVESGVLRSDSHILNATREREGAGRPARLAVGQGAWTRWTSSAPATSARSRSSRRRAPATCSPRSRPTSTSRRSTCRRP